MTFLLSSVAYFKGDVHTLIFQALNEVEQAFVIVFVRTGRTQFECDKCLMQSSLT